MNSSFSRMFLEGFRIVILRPKSLWSLSHPYSKSFQLFLSGDLFFCWRKALGISTYPVILPISHALVGKAQQALTKTKGSVPKHDVSHLQTLQLVAVTWAYVHEKQSQPHEKHVWLFHTFSICIPESQNSRLPQMPRILTDEKIEAWNWREPYRDIKTP